MTIETLKKELEKWPNEAFVQILLNTEIREPKWFGKYKKNQHEILIIVTE